MRIIFSQNVIYFLTDLIEILYNKEYFGFKDSAKKYVEDLVIEIESSITTKHKKFAPEYFSHYGKNMYYVSYRRNKNTTWYIFFNYTQEMYYIRFIGNNHSIGQYL